MTKNNTEIPTGYKSSELGVIPEGWQVKRIKDFGKVLTGNTPPTSEIENYGNDFLFVSPADLSESKYITTTEKRLSNKGFYISRMMPKGTVLFTCIGSTIGKTGIASIDLTSNQQINAIICDKQYSNEFLYYELCFKSGKIKLLAGEQAVPIINKSDFENIKIICPPLGEQNRIAELLGTWDMAIELQGRKVALLQSRKCALMQQLLTPRRRLPNFSEPWKTTKLGEIAERVTRKNTENNLNVMTISAQKGFVSQTDFFNKSIASEITDNYFLVHKDEFCYNKSYCNGYPMGAIKRLNSAEKAVVTTLYICFRIKCDKCDIEFLEQYFEAGLLNKNLMKIANEGGRAHGLLNVTPSDFFAMSLEIPSLDEQRAIAEVLTTADREIELATQNLTALRSQKRALMQQLLTGKKQVRI